MRDVVAERRRRRGPRRRFRLAVADMRRPLTLVERWQVRFEDWANRIAELRARRRVRAVQRQIERENR